MKVFLEKDANLWINGKEYKIKAGTQELNDEIARILIDAGYAKPIEEQKSRGKT
jgi:hypothetical protein